MASVTGALHAQTTPAPADRLAETGVLNAAIEQELDAAGAVLRVVSVTPSAQSLAAPVDGPLEVVFDRAVDPSSLDATSFAVLGRWSGVVRGSLSVTNETVTFVPDRPLSAGDWLTVRLSRNVGALDGSELTGGYAWNFWSRAEPASLQFTKLAELNPGEVPYGAHGGDLDSDGDLDLVVPNEGDDNVAVFLNNGGGGFGEATFFGTGKVPSPIEAADFNGDQHIDLVVSNTLSDDLSLLLGRGDGTFEPERRYPTGLNPRGAAPTDLNRDGRLDLILANRSSNDLTFLGNLGGGTFSKNVQIDAPGFGETQVAATDFNGDGLEDFLIAYLASSRVTSVAAQPNGNYLIIDQESAGGEVWQMAIGDLNGDGLVDAVTANHFDDRMGVLLATGPGQFASVVSYTSGIKPIAIDLGDLDGDGDLDAVTSNFISADFSVFENLGDGTFVLNQSVPANASGSCAVLHDLDGDGDLDLSGIDELDNSVLLFRNN